MSDRDKILDEIIPFVGSGGGGGGTVYITDQIVWKPGVPSSGAQVATWAEVMTRFGLAKGYVEICIDNSVAACTVPAGTYDLEGRVFLTTPNLRANTTGGGLCHYVVTIGPGALLENLGGAYGVMSITSNNAAAPSLSFTPSSDPTNLPVFFLQKGALLYNQGTYPMFEVNSDFFIIFLEYGAGWDSTMVAGPIFSIGPAGMVLLEGMSLAQMVGDAISGTGMLALINDITSATGAFPSFLGTKFRLTGVESGEETIDGTDIDTTVTLVTPMGDDAYRVYLTPIDGTVSAAMHCWVSDKTAAGFKINLSSSPGTGESVKVNWSVSKA